MESEDMLLLFRQVSAPGPTLGIEYGKAFTFTFFTLKLNVD